MINLTGLWPNLSRAYEIARLGGFTLGVVFDPEYVQGPEDYKKDKAIL